MPEQSINRTIPDAVVVELQPQQLTASLTSTAIDLTGQRLNPRYRLGRCLSKGMLGDVYNAHDRIGNRACSLKLVHHRLSNAFHLQQRLAYEAMIISRLSHHNIIEGYEYSSDEEGNFLLTMEPLDGIDLYELLAASRELPLTRVLEILGAVGAALQYLHDLGIVHQDISPRSIFLNQEYILSTRQTIEVIKVWNFGLARQLLPGGSRPNSSEVTDSLRRHLISSPSAYRAPESLGPSGDEVDARADQWSLAMLAYRMLTGKLPLQYNELRSPKLATEGSILQGLQQVQPELPEHIVLAIKKALSKDREQRFVRILDFIQALDSDLLVCQRPTREISLDELIEKSRPGKSQTEAVPVPIEVEETTRKYPTLSLPRLLLQARVPVPHRESPEELVMPWEWSSVASRWWWLWGCAVLLFLGCAVGRSLRHRRDASTDPVIAAALLQGPPMQASAAAPLPPPEFIVVRLLPEDVQESGQSLKEQPAPATPKRRPEDGSFGDGSLRHSKRWAVKESRCSDGENALSDVETCLVNAQKEYVNGNYQEAVAMARAVQNRSPARSWRIIGAAACFLKDGALVRDASRHLRSEDLAQRLVAYVCRRNGMDMAGNPLKPSI
jgi:serine/threonine-protein kinase